MVLQDVEVEEIKTKGVGRDPGRTVFRVRHPGGAGGGLRGCFSHARKQVTLTLPL